MEINRSRFISYVNRAVTEAEAQEFIATIKKKHWDATHNCSAYICGEQDEHQKANDDGEPSGTAGKPILEVIKKNDLKDTVIVVTRYFGGIKLGAGGLIRAYGKSASIGIKTVGIIERSLFRKISFLIDYTYWGKIEKNLRDQRYRIHETTYADKINLVVLAKVGEEEILEEKMIDYTSGQINIERKGFIYVDEKLE
ncbi:YigZ family protein [Heliorestis acidaminivorans]|uniref:YigZ family protein n=2 Tax=Heliorestis acidaminivorans TaxID=553427 RepID=A0A6I0F1X5_9FIRM|nr:YigZ family protein [Heliorestis acidaminivorans]